MAKTKIVEENELIATRIPPGDNWDVDGVRIEGLVMALTQYMRKNKFKGHYRLEPLNGKLFAIKAYEEQEPEPEMIYFDLYGEGPESAVIKK